MVWWKYIAFQTTDKDPSTGEYLIVRYLLLKDFCDAIYMHDISRSTPYRVSQGYELGTSGNTRDVPYNLHFDINKSEKYCKPLWFTIFYIDYIILIK